MIIPENIDGSRLALVYLEATAADKAEAYVRGYNDCLTSIRHNNKGPISGLWTKIDQQRPLEGQEVIAFADGAFVVNAVYRNGEFFDLVQDADGAYFMTTTAGVSHWQPLPSPPEDKN